jgi:hypothetical protein
VLREFHEFPLLSGEQGEGEVERDHIAAGFEHPPPTLVL